MYIMHIKHELPNYLVISELINECNCMQYALILYCIKYKLGFYPILHKTLYYSFLKKTQYKNVI